MKDFVNDIMPYAETHYRVVRDRQHRAIAGLSMGGAHTLNIAIPHPDEFAYVGVFSSGIFGIVPWRSGASSRRGPSWEQQHLAELDNRGGEERSEAVLVLDRQRRFAADHHQSHCGAVRKTWLPPSVSGKRRGSHLDQLARVSERVRSAPVSIGATLIQSRFMFQGLEHTAIASPDPKRLAEWYVQNLDFRINYTYGGNYFVRASNGTLIEFIPSEGIARRKNERSRHSSPGNHRGRFRRRHGGVAQARHRVSHPTHRVQGNRLIFFSDGDGNFVHLIHRPQPLP